MKTCQKFNDMKAIIRNNRHVLARNKPMAVKHKIAWMSIT